MYQNEPQFQGLPRKSYQSRSTFIGLHPRCPAEQFESVQSPAFDAYPENDCFFYHFFNVLTLFFGGSIRFSSDFPGLLE